MTFSGSEGWLGGGMGMEDGEGEREGLLAIMEVQEVEHKKYIFFPNLFCDNT